MSELAIAQLIDRLANPDYATRKKAVEHLAALGQAAVPKLQEALQSTSILTQARAVDALGQIGAREAIPDLVALLERDGREEILVEVVGALERISALHYHPDVQIRIERAKRTYEARLQENTRLSQYRYATLLSWDELLQQYQSRERLSARLPKQNPTGEATFHRALPSDMDALIARLRDPDYAIGKAVTARLIEIGEPAVEPLLAAKLTHLSRQRQISVLGKIGDPRALVPLITLYRAALSETTSELSDADLINTLQLALVELAEKAGAAPTPERIPTLVMLTKELRTLLPQAAVHVAQGLRQLAQTHPTPELRQALPALKGSFFQPVPLEFHAIRRAVEQATSQWKDLPLTATAPTDDSDLPRPASEVSTDG